MTWFSRSAISRASSRLTKRLSDVRKPCSFSPDSESLSPVIAHLVYMQCGCRCPAKTIPRSRFLGRYILLGILGYMQVSSLYHTAAQIILSVTARLFVIFRKDWFGSSVFLCLFYFALFELRPTVFHPLLVGWKRCYVTP